MGKYASVVMVRKKARDRPSRDLYSSLSVSRKYSGLPQAARPDRNDTLSETESSRVVRPY